MSLEVRWLLWDWLSYSVSHTNADWRKKNLGNSEKKSFRETVASLGIIGAQLTTPETPRASRHHRIERFIKRALICTSIMPRDATITDSGCIFSSWILMNEIQLKAFTYKTNLQSVCVCVCSRYLLSSHVYILCIYTCICIYVPIHIYTYLPTRIFALFSIPTFLVVYYMRRGKGGGRVIDKPDESLIVLWWMFHHAGVGIHQGTLIRFPAEEIKGWWSLMGVHAEESPLNLVKLN